MEKQKERSGISGTSLIYMMESLMEQGYTDEEAILLVITSVTPEVSTPEEIRQAEELRKRGPKNESELKSGPGRVIPMTKAGEVDYDRIEDPQTYAECLTSEFGEEAPAILEELLSEQEGLLAKARNGSNVIETARKVKKINAEINRLRGVQQILSPA